MNVFIGHIDRKIYVCVVLLLLIPIAALCKSDFKVAYQIDDQVISNYDIDQAKKLHNLMTGSIPDPDLVIRTSGEMRLSNFLLWQAAYAELYFTDVYWPDFNERELDIALKEYSTRERRFGSIIEDDKSNDKKDKSFHEKLSLKKASK